MANESGLAYQNGATIEAESMRPYYTTIGSEEAVFKAAYRQGLALVLKGPTGCGKTRFVEAMAYDLGRPLITVACHDDLTTADLVGSNQDSFQSQPASNLANLLCGVRTKDKLSGSVKGPRLSH